MNFGEEFALQCKRFPDKIGQGGYGTVWKGQNTVTAQYVAIKEAATDDETMTKARAEYEVLESLKHPNVVQTYAFIYDSMRKISSIYMEYVSEGSLHDVIRNSYPDGMPTGLIKKYTEGVLQGLQCAHSKGLIHRDIKPANMLVGTSGQLKLADFGLCKRVSDRTSVEKQCVGTIRYMSPRSFKALYDIRSDLWAVGCTLIEMATGVPPYSDSDLQGISLGFAIGNGTIRPVVPMVWDPLREFIEQCLDETSRTVCEELLVHDFLTRSDSTIFETSASEILTEQHSSYLSSGSPSNQPTMSFKSATFQVTDSDGLKSLVEWLSSRENEEIQSIINPAEALEALLRGACVDNDPPDYIFQRVLLHSCFRYIAVLFCKIQCVSGPVSMQTGMRHYKSKEVQTTIERCLKYVSTALNGLNGLDEEEESISSFQYLLNIVKSGLLLLKEAGVVESHVVRTQCLASDTLLRPDCPLDEKTVKILGSYGFIHETREHNLFTKVFKLLCGRAALKSESYVPSLCGELHSYCERDDSDWEIKHACLETLYQLAVHATDGRLHHDAFFGDGNSEGSCGILALLEDPVWRVREKAAEIILALLHAKSSVPMHGTVTNYAINKCLGLILKDPDAKVHVALKNVRKHIVNRPAIDWCRVGYTYDVEELPVMELASLKVASSDFLEWWEARSPSPSRTPVVTLTPQQVIFQGKPEVLWVEFFNRLANIPPYNKEPHFTTKFSYLFPLVRYLMQCEDTLGTGGLNPKRDTLREDTDYLPFQTYFPVETMIDDLIWLDAKCSFFLGASNVVVEERMHGYSRGCFLIRPSYREPGKLVLSSRSKQHSPSPSSGALKTTHKIIFYRSEINQQKINHLIVDSFPITRQEAQRPIKSLRDLVEWLFVIAPADFKTGVGVSILENEEPLYPYS